VDPLGGTTVLPSFRTFSVEDPEPSCLISDFQSIQNDKPHIQTILIIPMSLVDGVKPHPNMEQTFKHWSVLISEGFGGFGGLAKPDHILAPAKNAASQTRSHKQAQGM
jgi:hypothetical protein